MRSGAWPEVQQEHTDVTGVDDPVTIQITDPGTIEAEEQDPDVAGVDLTGVIEITETAIACNTLLTAIQDPIAVGIDEFPPADLAEIDLTIGIAVR